MNYQQEEQPCKSKKGWNKYHCLRQGSFLSRMGWRLQELQMQRDWWAFPLTGHLWSYHCLMHCTPKVNGTEVRQGSLLFYRVAVVYWVQVQTSYFRDPTAAQWCVNIYVREGKKVMELHFAFTGQSCALDCGQPTWHEQIFQGLISLHDLWWTWTSLRCLDGFASLQKQKKRLSYSYSSKVVPGAAVRSWGERGHRWWWLNANNPNLSTWASCPSQTGRTPPVAVEKGGFASAGRGMCGQGNQGQNPKQEQRATNGACVPVWTGSLSGHCTGRAVTRALLGMATATQQSLQSGEWWCCPGVCKTHWHQPKDRTESTGEHLPFPGVLPGRDLAWASQITASILHKWQCVTLHPLLTIQSSHEMELWRGLTLLLHGAEYVSYFLTLLNFLNLIFKLPC